jgi:hypothetical protein
MESDEIHIPHALCFRWIKYAEHEIVERFNLSPPDKTKTKYHTSYCFSKKNTNRYFRKHLGFTFTYNLGKGKVFDYAIIYVKDYRKLMLFRIKYGI